MANLFIYVLYYFLSPQRSIISNAKDNYFYNSKPLTNLERSTITFMLVAYHLAFKLLPIMLGVSIFLLKYWSIVLCLKFFISLILLAIISLYFAGLIYTLLKAVTPAHIFTVVFTIVNSSSTILIIVFANMISQFTVNITQSYFLFPVFSNLNIFFDFLPIMQRILLPLVYALLAIIAYIVIIRLSFASAPKKNREQYSRSHFLTFANKNTITAKKTLFKRIMHKDEIYLEPIIQGIWNIFSLPFLLLAVNAFRNAQEIFSKSSYLLSAIWCIAVCTVNFGEYRYSKNPKANWIISLMKNEIHENRKIVLKLLYKKWLFLIIVPLIFGLLAFTYSIVDFFIYAFVIFLLYTSSFFIVQNAATHTYEVFSSEKGHKIIGDGNIISSLIIPAIIYLLLFFSNTLNERFFKNIPVLEVCVLLFLSVICFLVYRQSIFVRSNNKSN